MKYNKNADKVECPYCGRKYFIEDYTTSTLAQPVVTYVNGAPHVTDPNVYTTRCTCMHCGKQFEFQEYGTNSDALEIKKI